MKIAVAAAAPDLDAEVEHRLGLCPYLLVIDTESMAFEAVPVPSGAGGPPSLKLRRARPDEALAKTGGPGAGPGAVALALARDARALLAGYVSPDVARTLRRNGVEVVNSEAGTLEIAQVLVACTGLLLTIPLTAAASAALLSGGPPSPGLRRAMPSVASAEEGGPWGRDDQRSGRRGSPERKHSAITSLASALRSPGRRTLWGILAGEAALGVVLLTAGIILGSGFRPSLPWHGDEDTPAAHLDSARQTIDGGRPDRALCRLWRARQLAPSDPRAHVWLGHACYLMGWPEQAAHEFETASELDPSDPRPLRYLGWLYTEVGRYERAVHALGSCKLMQPGDPEVVCDLAIAYTGLGEWGRAEALAEHALRLAPGMERAEQVLEAILGQTTGRPSRMPEKGNRGRPDTH